MKNFKQDIKLVSSSELCKISSTYYKYFEEANYYSGYECLGVFSHVNVNGYADYAILDVTEEDKRLIESSVNLKSGQYVYRFETEKSRLCGMKPLVKIDLNKEMVYFLVDSDSDEIKFESRGSKIRYMKALEKYFI